MNRLSSILKNDLISLLDQNKSIIEIALLYNTSDSSIRRWMHRLELSNRIKSKRSFTEEELNLIKTEYISGSGFHEIALLLNATGPGIEYVVKHRLKIELRDEWYHQNDQYFKIIDTEDKAYWLGFIYADGCISKNTLIIELHAQDLDHLIKLSNSLETDRPIRKIISTHRNGTAKETARFTVTSSSLINDLENLNITKAKAFICKPPLDLIPVSLQRHFWRGVIDGDGCISILYNKQYEYSKIEFGITGNINTCKSFIDWNLQFGTKFNLSKDKSSFRARLSRNKKSIKPILQTFYTNCSIFLDRKKAKADTFLLEA